MVIGSFFFRKTEPITTDNRLSTYKKGELFCVEDVENARMFPKVSHIYKLPSTTQLLQSQT